MHFTISEEILEKFPLLNIGVVIAKGIDNSRDHAEIVVLLDEQARFVQSNYDLATLSENSKIRVWREAYQSFGAKPKKYRSSVENLYRMILGGLPLRHINAIVDLYNFISLKHMVPVGGDDLNKVEGDITLRCAKRDESFIRLNTEEVDHPKEGEIVYTDQKEVLSRRWNWRECEKTKMTEQSKNIMLVVEGLPPVSRWNIELIIKELGERVEEFFGGEISTTILSSEKREIIIL